MSKAKFTILKQCEHCAEMFEARDRTKDTKGTVGFDTLRYIA